MDASGVSSEAQTVEFAAARERLTREFAGIINPELVGHVLHDSWQVLSSSKVPTFVPLLAERFARERLRARTHIEDPSARARPAVMFLCNHNAGRSQMAAGWFNHLAGGAALVYTGGSEPAADVNPVAIEAMAEVGIDISKEFPKPWSDEVLRSVDVVVTMGCGDSCPIVPGVRYLDWELDDPAGKPIEAVRPIRDEIRVRVSSLLRELGVAGTS